MKKLTSIIAIALLTTTVFFNANAEDKKSEKGTTTSVENYNASNLNAGLYEVGHVNSLKLNVLLTKDEGKIAIVKLIDANGNTLDEQVIGKKAKGFNLRYDFNAIETGKYYLEMTNGASILTKEIVKTNTTLSY